MRVKAVVAYDGSCFEGFQRQTRTQQTVTTAIEKALRSLQIDSSITGSGRTDAGVHATGQIIHFDLPYYWRDLQKLRHALNRRLDAVAFKYITPTSDDFHARFDAKVRVYRYFFKTVKPTVFERNYLSYYSDFDPQILTKTLSLFEGEHDFAYFHKTGADPHTTQRHIYQSCYRSFGAYHAIYFKANGFLRSQVRMMVEAAMQCAQKQMTLKELERQIACKERYITDLAPGSGLYLARVLY